MQSLGGSNTILFYSILFYSVLLYSVLFYSILFYSRLCPSTAGSSPPPESSIFLCPLLSLSIPLPVAPQCHLSNDVGSNTEALNVQYGETVPFGALVYGLLASTSDLLMSSSSVLINRLFGPVTKGLDSLMFTNAAAEFPRTLSCEDPSFDASLTDCYFQQQQQQQSSYLLCVLSQAS